jgi:hypothetical protein
MEDILYGGAIEWDEDEKVSPFIEFDCAVVISID